MKLAPIVLFVYNRLDHTKKTIDKLKNNSLAVDSEIFIYSDASKGTEDLVEVSRVRNYIKSINGFKKIIIIEREINFGLAKSIINGVSEVVKQFGKVIVLEDDLITSPYFLNFMNDALQFYESNNDIGSITGFNYPLKINSNYSYGSYLYPRCSSKSWAIWQDVWEDIEFDENEIIRKWTLTNIETKILPYGKDLIRMFRSQMLQNIDSWAVRFAINQIMLDRYTVYPFESYVTDIGGDSGVHSDNCLPHKVKISNKIAVNFNNVYDKKIGYSYQKYLMIYFIKSKVHILINKFKKIYSAIAG